MSNLLALDQASRVSGWAFFQDGELKSFLGVLFLRPFCGEIVQVFSKKDWSELEV